MSRSIGIVVEFPAGHAGDFRVDINLKGEQVSQQFAGGRAAMEAALLVHDALHALADEHDEEIAELTEESAQAHPHPRTSPNAGSFLDEAAGHQIPLEPDETLIVDNLGETELGRMATPGGQIDPVDEAGLDALQHLADLISPPSPVETSPPPRPSPLQAALDRVETLCFQAREQAAAGQRKALAGATDAATALLRGAHQSALGASAALIAIEDSADLLSSSDLAAQNLQVMRNVLKSVQSTLIAGGPWPPDLLAAINTLA